MSMIHEDNIMRAICMGKREREQIFAIIGKFHAVMGWSLITIIKLWGGCLVNKLVWAKKGMYVRIRGIITAEFCVCCSD